MKKIAILSLSLFLFANSYAATPIGIKAGANGANMVNLPEGANNTTKMSFYAGVYSEIELGSRLTLKPQIVYSRQGARIDPDLIFTSSESTELLSEGELNRHIRLNYINIPLVLSYRVWGDLAVNISPQLGIFIGGREHIVYHNRTTNRDLNDLKQFDFSLGVGVEYQIWSRLDVTVNYNSGLTNIVKSRSEFNSINIKNGVLQLGFEFLLFE